jgi:hypothetical protein
VETLNVARQTTNLLCSNFSTSRKASVRGRYAEFVAMEEASARVFTQPLRRGFSFHVYSTRRPATISAASVASRASSPRVPNLQRAFDLHGVLLGFPLFGSRKDSTMRTAAAHIDAVGCGAF